MSVSPNGTIEKFEIQLKAKYRVNCVTKLKLHQLMIDASKQHMVCIDFCRILRGNVINILFY